jgi:outer membrane receptor protein involved in Fe transport
MTARIRMMMGLILAGGLAHSEPATTTTASAVVVVTAERFPVERLTTTRNVETIDADRLKATATPNLAEALRQTAGTLSPKSYGPEGVSHGTMNSQFSIRGMRGGELVLFNGMPIQSAASGGYNLDALSVGSVGSVEVLKGAGSVLYGADAESGVINVTTRKRQTDKPYRFSFDAGNRESLSAGGGLSGDLLDLDAEYHHLGGLNEISRSHTGKYRYDSTDLDRVNYGAVADLDNGLMADILGGGYDIGYRKIADSGQLLETTDQNYQWNFADVRLEREHVNLKAFAGYGQLESERTGITTTDDRALNVQTGLKGDYRYSLGMLDHTLGGDYTYRAVESELQYGSHHRQDIGLVTEVKMTPWDRLTASLGAREQFIFADAEGDDYDRLLPCAGLNLRLVKGLHAFVDSGKSFRAPTFNQMYYDSDFMVGNPTLGPEEGWAHQAGLKFESRVLSGSVAAFYMDYQDKIVLDNKRQPSSYVNADSFESIGVDWDLTAHPFFAAGTPLLEPLAVEVSGYWADPTTENAAGIQSQSGDRFQIAPGLAYATDRWRAGVRFPAAANRENGLSDYCTVNVSGAVRYRQGWVKAGVLNLTDEQVASSGNMSQGSMSRYEYYGLPRMITVGYETVF